MANALLKLELACPKCTSHDVRSRRDKTRICRRCGHTGPAPDFEPKPAVIESSD